jgi:hypothetical protein
VACLKEKLPCDHYPSLDIRELFRQGQSGDLLVVWREDFEDRRLGHALLRWRAGDLVLNWRVFESPLLTRRGGEDAVGVVHRQSSIGGHKPLFVCSGCRAGREVIFYTDSGWACRTCHKLNYASQHLSTIDRKELRFKELVRLGAKGPRPKGMWRSTHQKLRREYLALRRELGGDEEIVVPRHREPPVRTFYAKPEDMPGLRRSIPGDTGSEPLARGQDTGLDDLYDPRLPLGGHAAR